MPAHFNGIAKSYDLLSGLIFGKIIRQSQIDQLSFISAGSVVLIVGGGTGWILEEMAKIHATGLTITYIDSSSKMIELAAKRHLAGNSVEFITAAIENVTFTHQFDVIITPFLFDMFLQDTCCKIITNLKSCIKHNGLWLYSDFYLTSKSPYWQKIVLRFMYCFFRISCGIDAKKLPDLKRYFLSYKIIMEKTYGRGFIINRIFKNCL